MAKSYWSTFSGQRLSRRRTLAMSAGAAFLAACGGDDDPPAGSGSMGVTGLLAQPADTSDKAKRGGVRKTYLATDPTTFDIHIFQITAQSFVWAVGSLLFTLLPGNQAPPKLAVQGDVAQSFELSPDKLTLSVKLHPQAKWGPIGANSRGIVPDSVAGRVIDAEDVLASWERFSEIGLGRTELNNSKSPNAPVTSVEAPDASTVVFKLKQPDSTLLPTMSISNVGYFYLVPKEGKGDKIDFKRTMVGGGPFYLDEYTPSARITFKRNPHFEARDKQKRPYVDAVEAPIMNDAAQGQAQFRTGNIWSAAGGLGLPLGVTSADVLPIKRDLPQLNLYNLGVASDPQKMIMGQHAQSAFRDKRVRQAMFLAWDRDAYIDMIFNVSKFKDGGLPVETRYSSAFPCDLRGYPGGTYDGYWLDPNGKDFGPNARYYKRDAAEAKKLLAAAGFADGLEFDHLWSLPNSFGPGTGRAVDTLNATIADAGFKPTVKNLQTPQWLETVQNSKGNFQGVATGIDSGGPDPASYLFQHYHKDGTRFGGFNPAGTGWSADGDPNLNDNIVKMKQEFDESKRKALAAELSRYIAENGYNPRYPGGASSLGIQWPVLQNANVWIGDFPRQWANEWIDDTQAPLKK